jgi:hypothetical protein
MKSSHESERLSKLFPDPYAMLPEMMDSQRSVGTSEPDTQIL